MLNLGEVVYASDYHVAYGSAIGSDRISIFGLLIRKGSSDPSAKSTGDLGA